MGRADPGRHPTVDDGGDPRVEGDRRLLMSLAYRMLGTIADAEDAVQEAYVRWYRLDDVERAAIDVPHLWLRRVVSRICLDWLGSARARRETYVGPWLPEPLPSQTFAEPAADPADRAALDDTVSSALLVVLERMTPPERVVFVLHEVFALPFDEIADIVGRTPGACRQLAYSARRRVDAARSRRSTPRQHDEVVRAFSAAARSGDLEALVSVLDPDVVVRSDGGGVVSAARRPVQGADRVVRFLAGVRRKFRADRMTEEQTHDGLGLVLWDGPRVLGVVTLDVVEGLITDVRVVLNPRKLSLWDGTAAEPRPAAPDAPDVTG